MERSSRKIRDHLIRCFNCLAGTYQCSKIQGIRSWHGLDGVFAEPEISKRKFRKWRTEDNFERSILPYDVECLTAPNFPDNNQASRPLPMWTFTRQAECHHTAMWRQAISWSQLVPCTLFAIMPSAVLSLRGFIARVLRYDSHYPSCFSKRSLVSLLADANVSLYPAVPLAMNTTWYM